MTKTIVPLVLAGMTFTHSIRAQDQSSQQTGHQVPVQHSTKAVKQFFDAFGKGDYNGIVNSFDDQCKIIAVRDKERINGELYGTYTGKEGVKEFLKNLSSTFDTKAFSVSNIIGQGDIVYANGSFTHLVKTTGKLYSSDWSLMCRVKDGKILEYHFYEDTMSFAEASK